MSTIIGLAQNFVGSNNLNMLMPIGQFGTRLHGGKDAASPRYIFTQLRYVFITVGGEVVMGARMLQAPFISSPSFGMSA